MKSPSWWCVVAGRLVSCETEPDIPRLESGTYEVAHYPDEP
jgi:hypothetical protein